MHGFLIYNTECNKQIKLCEYIPQYLYIYCDEIIPHFPIIRSLETIIVPLKSMANDSNDLIYTINSKFYLRTRYL